MHQPDLPFEPSADRSSADDLKSRLLLVRPELARDPGGLSAALLVLLAAELGPNVHRLTMRSRLPGQEVARVVRRLTDGGFWDGVRATVTWRADQEAHPEFWLDVDVALGRLLRRVGEDGRPEWAKPGEAWVKDFEYRRGEADGPVHTRYLPFERYAPDVVPPDEESLDPSTDAGERPDTPPRPRSVADSGPRLFRLAPSSIDAPVWLGLAEPSNPAPLRRDRAEARRPPSSRVSPRTRPLTKTAAPVDTVLVTKWTEADWLG